VMEGGPNCWSTLLEKTGKFVSIRQTPRAASRHLPSKVAIAAWEYENSEWFSLEMAVQYIVTTTLQPPHCWKQRFGIVNYFEWRRTRRFGPHFSAMLLSTCRLLLVCWQWKSMARLRIRFCDHCNKSGGVLWDKTKRLIKISSELGRYEQPSVVICKHTSHELRFLIRAFLNFLDARKKQLKLQLKEAKNKERRRKNRTVLERLYKYNLMATK
jgi:hypothetical protein